ncbi:MULTISPECIES: CocE/NonD family hydrolase [unclassified Amycolatopsis]|uniref:CocE/NonD family hydrolase n=1 Tax=unclassified Amycolatopsis TaxID=2618356 RepID=UPI001C6A6B04|nr:CocE/NonD family hydrolase [Amycolatopsis sp. DSM 110486]QYN21508.1 CocE/NonD family hydrolase [Amycolatopsis sp. DSM 110486]
MSEPLSPADLSVHFAGLDLSKPVAPSTSSTDPFFTYARPETHGVHVSKVQVEMRDGVLLAGELHRPANPDGTPASGRFPGIVYEFNGYNAVSFMGAGARSFVTRGYVALVCSVRGSGDSPGEIDPFGPQEQRDNVDLIAWLGTQPFSTGKVGQMGVSYGGHTTILAAVHQPEHLTAVIATQALSDWYEDTIYLGGGIYNNRIRGWQKDTAPATLETYPQHPLYDDFWRERSVRARWDRLDVPVLDVGGWLDQYRNAMVKNFRARPENVWMVAGPWSHGMLPGQFEDIATAAYLAWWDRWLSDDVPGLLPETKVTSYEMPDAGWKQYSTWPPSESREDHLTFASGGKLVAGSVEKTTDAFDVETGALLAETEFLPADLVLAGTPFVDLRVSFTADEGYIAVVLEDLGPDDAASRVTHGFLRASHRDGNEQRVPVEPGASYDLRVPLWATHHRFKAGHRLRIRVASRDEGVIDSDSPAGTVTVHYGPSTFTYQMIG